jgi:hypothetical protein
MLGSQYPGPVSMRTRKLDGRFHTLASRRSKEGLPQPSARSRTQPFGEFSGEIGYMTLNHRWTAARQFSLQCFHYIRMIVSHIVYAIARQEIHDPAAVRRKQLGSNAPLVSYVHLEQPEEPNPLRIDTLRVPR